MDIQNTNPNILVTYYNALINIQQRNKNLYTEDKSRKIKPNSIPTILEIE